MSYNFINQGDKQIKSGKTQDATLTFSFWLSEHGLESDPQNFKTILLISIEPWEIYNKLAMTMVTQYCMIRQGQLYDGPIPL